MREGWREVRGGNRSQAGVGMDWDNGFDHVEIQVSSQRKTKMTQPRKDQQPPIQNLTDCVITKQQTKL